MRRFLVPSLAFLVAAAPSFAAESDAATQGVATSTGFEDIDCGEPTLGEAPATGMGTTTNTVDPINGRAIDPNLKPVIVTLRDGSTLAIAVSSAESAAVLRADPDKYAVAARANQKFDASRHGGAGGSSSGGQAARPGPERNGNPTR